MRSLAISLSALALFGCIGTLDNPEEFLSGDNCKVEERFFGGNDAGDSKCGTSVCHKTAVATQGNLDLASPGVANRLRTQMSTCRDAADAGKPLISFMLEKVKPNPSCGTAMPYGMSTGLSTADYACLEKYIKSLTSDGGI